MVPNPLGEKVALELKECEETPKNMEETARYRLIGKQTPEKQCSLEFPKASDSSLGLHVDVSVGPKKLFGGETKEAKDQKSQLGSESLGSLGEKSQLGSESLGSLGEKSKLGSESLEEKTGLGLKSNQLFGEPRKIELSSLERVWQLTHQGLLNEIDHALDMVPLDEEEGKRCGRVVEYLQESRMILETGLKEIQGIQNAWLKTCSVVDSPKDPEEVLQTVTMGLGDVRKDLKAWVPAMKDEYHSLVVDTQAIEPVDVASLAPDSVEFVPGKLVCVVKAGPKGGKKKCRGVICGNMMENDSSPVGVYASGADATLIRTVLRHSVLKNWGCTITDIKTAFLLAPRVEIPGKREVVVVPPRILVEAGICKGSERWKIKRALYGLPSSPACWAMHRDKTLKTFQWWDPKIESSCCLEQSPEGNLWKVLGVDKLGQSRVVGHVLVYVDDMMVLGPENVRKGFMTRMIDEWKCTPGDTVSQTEWTRFSGFELQRGEDGVSLKVSQISYINELLKRHEVQVEKPHPMPKCDTEEPPEEQVTGDQIREAQMYVGELLWAAVRSRPDIAYVVSVLGQQVTKRPRWVVQLSKHVLGYLLGTRDYCLQYKAEVKGHGPEDTLQIPRHKGLVEAFSDISFAPNGNRSYQGVVVTYAGCPVQWEANRQAFHTMSTAESELVAALEAMTMAQSVEALLQSMYPEVVFEKVLYGDNQSALSIIEKPDGSWRTRHLRLRANVLKEKLKSEPLKWHVRHQKGSHLVADLLTKPICQLGSWKRFWEFMEFYVPETTNLECELVSGEAANNVKDSLVFGEAANDVKDSLVFGEAANDVKDSLVFGEAANDVKKSLVFGEAANDVKKSMVFGEAANDVKKEVRFTDELHEKSRLCEVSVEGSLRAKLAKVSVAMSVLGALPFQEGTGGWNEKCKGIILLVLTVATLVWLVQLVKVQQGLRKEEEVKPLSHLKKSIVAKKDDENFGNTQNKERTRIKSGNDKRTRIKEPVPQVEGTRENEPVLEKLKCEQKERLVFNDLVDSRVVGLGRRITCTAGSVVGEYVCTVNSFSQERCDSVNVNSHHCPTGCPNFGGCGAVAMAKQSNPGVKLAAMKCSSGSSYSGLEAAISAGDEIGEPWNEGQFLKCPASGKDQWLEHMKSQKWLVRAHAEVRVRTFHPIHKKVPLDPKLLTGMRVSIAFDNDGNKFIVKDEWTSSIGNLFEPKKQWKGWTFFRMVSPEVDHLGGQWDGSTGRGEPVRSVKKVGDIGGCYTSGKGSEGEERIPEVGGYRKESTEEKGKRVAMQLPLDRQVPRDTVEGEDGSEWAFVTHFEKVG